MVVEVVSSESMEKTDLNDDNFFSADFLLKIAAWIHAQSRKLWKMVPLPLRFEVLKNEIAGDN